MYINEALEVFGLENAKNISQLEMQKIFRKLCMLYHPDQGGDELTMKLVIDAWETMKEAYAKDSHWCDWSAASKKADYSVTEMFREILAKIDHLDGLEINIAGSWLWIGGSTKMHETILKDVGFRNNKKKGLWAWSAGKNKRKWRKTVSQEKIYAKYGRKTSYTHGVMQIA